MTHRRSALPVACAAVAAAFLADTAAAAEPAIRPPPRPAPPAAERAELEKELAAARERLEAAAREVAELSTQLVPDDVIRMVVAGERRAMLGIQLGAVREGRGVEVAGVSPGGPAAAAGIRAGDVIVAVAGRRVATAGELAAAVGRLEPEVAAKIELERDGKRRTVEAVPRRAEPRPLVIPGEGFGLPAFGAGALRLPFPGFGPWGELELATLSKDLGRYFGAERGVLVVKVPADGQLKLRDGDVIVAIDGREPQSAAHALRILRSYQPGEKVKLAILRDRQPQTLEIEVPDAPAPAAFRAPPSGVPAPPRPPGERT